jgi:hypothetical protein
MIWHPYRIFLRANHQYAKYTLHNITGNVKLPIYNNSCEQIGIATLTCRTLNPRRFVADLFSKMLVLNFSQA